MANVILLYENAADDGTFEATPVWTLPLSYMQDPRPTRKARSNGLTLANTQFRIGLSTTKTLRALAFGPTNLTSSAQYRITRYTDNTYGTAIDNTGWVTVGSSAVPSLDLEWEDPNFWLGIAPIDDPDNAGLWVVHVFATDVNAQYWKFEIDDQTNPDAFVEIGRLYMGTAFIPSINFSENSFTFVTNTTMQQTPGGSSYFNRHPSARVFQFSFDYLEDDEMWEDVYRVGIISNLDKQVFVIADPDDTTHRNKRSFLGTLKSIPAWRLSTTFPGTASTGFEITEAL